MARISQGNGTSRDEQGVARWDSHGLVEQVYLVGGPLMRYSDAAGAVEALVFLHAKMMHWSAGTWRRLRRTWKCTAN